MTEAGRAVDNVECASHHPTLRARDLTLAFGPVQVLRGVSLDVAPNEIVGLIGPNGAGKTSLFDALSGLVPAEGTVEVCGIDVSDAPTHVRAEAGLGRSFQDARLFGSLTVLDALRTASELTARRTRDDGFVAALFKTPNSRRFERLASARAFEVVEALRLGAYRDRLVRELSTGTRRIVDLGCALVQGPRVLLLDEPSSGIAQREAEALGPVLQRVRSALACSILIIEHDMPLLLGLADRAIALELGLVVTDGDPREVLRHPQVVRGYLGGDIIAVNRSGAA